MVCINKSAPRRPLPSVRRPPPAVTSQDVWAIDAFIKKTINICIGK